jgi:hypothetical protein
MQRTIRHVAGAVIAGSAAALAIDALLQLALSAVRVTAPWWVNARVGEYGAWIVAAGLAWLLAPMLAGHAGRVANAHLVLPQSGTFGLVGTLMIVLPVLWLVATWLVTGARITTAGTWAHDGLVFLSPDYYAYVLTAHAPWVLAGAILIVVSRHVADPVDSERRGVEWRD